MAQAPAEADLHRHGTITSGGHQHVALPSGVKCYALARTLRFPKDRQWIGYGMGHLELLNRPEVYSQLHAWMREAT